MPFKFSKTQKKFFSFVLGLSFFVFFLDFFSYIHTETETYLVKVPALVPVEAVAVVTVVVVARDVILVVGVETVEALTATVAVVVVGLTRALGLLDGVHGAGVLQDTALRLVARVGHHLDRALFEGSGIPALDGG